MAGSSVIGALRVDLGLNSSEFSNGIANASTSLGKFGKAAGIGLAAVATAAASAAVALGFAVKGAIDHADALGKAAQKSGVTVEALSRLEYAAKFSDISIGQLTGGLTQLSKSMAEAAGNTTGQAATAFAALGINVLDANGKLRDSSDVFADVADRFSRLEDGATKTSLSMKILGKSGSDLVPLLNEGAAGLKRFADESDRTGNTITTRAAAGAEKFNDSMTRLSTVMSGIVNRIAGSDGVQNALQGMADTLSSPEFAQAAQSLAENVTTGINAIVLAFAKAENAASSFKRALNPDLQTIIDRQNEANGLPPALNLHPDFLGTGNAGVGGGASGATSLTGSATGAVAVSTFDFSSFLTPESTKGIDTLSDKLSGIKDGLAAIGPVAGIVQDNFKDMAFSAIGSLAGLSGALAGAFKDNKTFAVSTAILNGLQGVSYALGSSAPPWNFINAAAVGVDAAANVANILSTNPGSTSMPSFAGSSGGASAVQQQGSSLNLTIRGSGMIDVDDFAKQLAAGLADGGHPELAQQIKITRAA